MLHYQGKASKNVGHSTHVRGFWDTHLRSEFREILNNSSLFGRNQETSQIIYTLATFTLQTLFVRDSERKREKKVDQTRLRRTKFDHISFLVIAVIDYILHFAR